MDKMYTELVGTWGYQALTAANSGTFTFTIPAGARILQITGNPANNATLTVFRQPTLSFGTATTSYFNMRLLHGLCVSGNDAVVSGSQDIVGHAWNSFFVEYVKAGNT